MDARRDSVHQELLRTPKSTESVALRRRGSRATAYWAHGPRGLHGGVTAVQLLADFEMMYARKASQGAPTRNLRDVPPSPHFF